jgi:exosome complex RNA-binding protein Rrp42 (RNase PH superfamily)
MNSKNQSNFVNDITLSGSREDGREMLEMRHLRIIFNDSNDGCEVSLGKTKVFAKVFAKITEPSLSKPSEGSIKFMINLRIAENTNQTFNHQKSIDLTNELAKYLERNIKGSRYTKFNSLEHSIVRVCVF